MIEVKNLVKKYGNHLAVDHLNFTIEEGHIYGFLGPNGAGKSTTMNIMTGYLGATEGEVLINGHDILKEPEEAKKQIGYLPELPPLYMDMTVREYMEFAAELKKIPKAKRAESIDDVEKLVKIKDVEKRLIKNLSKGYRQRVGLAQALLGMPEIIILDEPTVGLDPKQIIEIRDLIRSLKEKHTVILSSHILQEISAVCDHVFIISKGTLVASDSMEHLESRMSGAQQLDVAVRGTKEQLEELHTLDGVQECRIVRELPEESAESSENDLTDAAETSDSDAGERNDEAAEFHLSLIAGENCDLRETVFRYCVEHDVVLLEQKVNTKTLEDVFLELTGNEEVREA